MQYILGLFLLVNVGLSFGQSSYQGNHLFELYTGGPNFMKFDFFGTEPNSITAVNSTSIPPSGLRYAYMISNDASIGFDVMYNSFKQSYVSTDTVFVDNQWQYLPSDYLEFKSRLRIQARFNFMIATSSPNVDSYIGVAVGTNSRWQKQWVNDSLTQNFKPVDLVVIPVSARLCYGFRYFFNYNSALGAEIGIGGPLFSFQYTYKL
ncbi:MAG: hypothetical protein ACO29Q_05755 [Crocinitomicaceae bacterium]